MAQVGCVFFTKREHEDNILLSPSLGSFTDDVNVCIGFYHVFLFSDPAFCLFNAFAELIPSFGNALVLSVVSRGVMLCVLSRLVLCFRSLMILSFYVLAGVVVFCQ